MVEPPGQNSENTVREFYASYATTVKKTMPEKGKELTQPPLLRTMVQEILVDISERTIHQFLHTQTHRLRSKSNKEFLSERRFIEIGRRIYS
ncbi:hypothetical protein H5410_015098 [Solanum commersonii]|uniref:Uncharacterized protein n=1 Tax=Solanum commersonii TaxID=4109 RepID=A0A9J5ZTC9_SOLCO|nr:hypothetical protein H5410_015098 [Solanum commersonii]